MKILLSAFACSPNTGSETGVGWRWAIELAKANHQVVVLTDATRKPAIDAELLLRPNENLTVECYRPRWLRRVPLNSTTAQMLYSSWQYSLLPFARLLNRRHQFDLIIHLTYGVFRHPSFLGFVGPTFVFGPVGGGEDAPWALKKSLPTKEKVKEILRSLLNNSAKFNPFLHLALSKAALILVKTVDTKFALPKRFQARAVVFAEIGIDSVTSSPSVQSRDVTKPLEVLFAGRLLGWKGVHLAIRAVADAIANGASMHLTIVGTGPLLAWEKAIVSDLGIGHAVTWVGHIPQKSLFALYEKMHCFLFPSLHDSSGNVVLEAMSFALPIVCLDVGGPATLVDETCATVVSTKAASEAMVVKGLSVAIARLQQDETLRLRHAAAALHQAKAMSWNSRTNGVVKLASTRLDGVR